ncbi:hypothetical protein CAEBREN_02302 [Caenorhabditis brenneri]|uniref:Uncharacterized protein n=1 Tax=Caenorhabditis brenneri TaxID=135651 RepID=G0NTA8_CAEBE|nr:hypothetical protein CAEBREN_02302 [Caenorhabditis brenneri]
MFKLLFISAFALCASLASAAGNVCTPTTVYRPSNSDAYYWPATWKEQQAAPALGGNQTCGWAVIVPKGYYAKLIMSGRMGDNTSHIQTIDAGANSIISTHENKEPYFFPSETFTVYVYADSDATFAMKIVWAKLPTKMDYSMGIGKNPKLVNITSDIFAAEYSSTTGLSLLAFPADKKRIASLRSTFVYEGKDSNGNYVSNLYLLYKSKKQWISSGSVIYVVNVEARNVEDKLLVQESGYTKDIAEYVEFSCQANSTCTGYLDAGNKTSALVSVDNTSQTLMYVTLNVNSYLTVYYGSPNDAGKYLTISGSTIQSNLPMTFGAPVVQYVVTGGKASFTFAVSNP